MPTLGTHPRKATLKGWSPDNLVLVAFGKAKAFNTTYHLWGDGGTKQMNEKARTTGLDVRVFMGMDESTVEEYNDGCNDDFYPDVYVAVDGWDSVIHGLIYTDATFEKEINRLMKEFNIPGKIYYTEQGMQGDNFVSMSGDKDTFEWMVKTYGKKLCFDVTERLTNKAIFDKDINQVVDMLKSLKIGARQLKNEGSYVAAQLTFSKSSSEVVKGLRKEGWKRLNKDRKQYRICMVKDHMQVEIVKSSKWHGPRIYIDGNWD